MGVNFLSGLFLIVMLGICSCALEAGNKKSESEVSTIDTSRTKHNNITDNFSHSDIIILDEQFIVGDSTKSKFKLFIDDYLQLQNALYSDNITMANTSANNMLKTIWSINSNVFNPESEKAWTQHLSLYNETLNGFNSTASLYEKRSYFSHISEVIYCSVKSFTINDDDLYVAYCKMAFNGKGAYWLSKSEVIQNPYIGQGMKSCGEIVEKL